MRETRGYYNLLHLGGSDTRLLAASSYEAQRDWSSHRRARSTPNLPHLNISWVTAMRLIGFVQERS